MDGEEILPEAMKYYCAARTLRKAGMDYDNGLLIILLQSCVEFSSWSYRFFSSDEFPKN
jgi:tRNA(Leu) C34 or U34 (ribose-2'-O)-methylase TrmL